MIEEQQLNETRPDVVEPMARATRPQRYAVAGRCRSRLERFLRSVLARRLPGTRLSVKGALAAALAAQAADLSALKSTSALANTGITLLNASVGDGVENGVLNIEVDPRLLRAAYPTSARLEPHTFVFRLALGVGAPTEADAGEGDGASLPPPQPDRGTRYIGGTCDRDELRMQVEVLRQPLGDLGISIDEGLDALCTGLQSPCQGTRERCNSIVRELECCGLRFYAVQRSWRLPRAGVLLIENSDALVRTYPALAFFEPRRFGGLAIVDRPKRAGDGARQGLLF